MKFFKKYSIVRTAITAIFVAFMVVFVADFMIGLRIDRSRLDALLAQAILMQEHEKESLFQAALKAQSQGLQPQFDLLERVAEESLMPSTWFDATHKMSDDDFLKALVACARYQDQNLLHCGKRLALTLVAESMVAHFNQELMSTAKLLMRNSDIERIQIKNIDSEILLHLGRDSKNELMMLQTDTSIPTELHVYRKDIRINDVKLGELTVAWSDASLAEIRVVVERNYLEKTEAARKDMDYRRRELIFARIIEMFIYLFVGTIVVVWVLFLFVLRPIQKMQVFCENLRRDFSFPPPDLSERHDEIGSLTRSLVTMSSEMQTMVQHLRQLLCATDAGG